MCLSLDIDYPERTLAKGQLKGYQWVVTHNGRGSRCGYVRVPKGHPWHGQNCNDINSDCHGGITFTDADKKCEKVDNDDGWWIGFDCAHYTDSPDPSLLPQKKSRIDLLDLASGHIWTQEEVENSCHKLCIEAGILNDE